MRVGGEDQVKLQSSVRAEDPAGDPPASTWSRR